MSEIPESGPGAQGPGKGVKVRNALQAGLGAYTFLRTEVSTSPMADRATVTASILSALSAIDLTATELAEIYTIVANAQAEAFYERTILENQKALEDLAAELQDDERRDYLAKFDAMIAAKKAPKVRF